MASNNKTFALMDTAAFAKMCDAVMKAQRKTDTDLQKLAVTAIGYSIVHGDVQPANRLFAAMQRSLRRDSMVKFLEQHGQVAWMSTSDKFEHFPRLGLEFDADKLMGLKWFEAKKEAAIVSQWDLRAEFDKFMKRATKMVQDGNVEVTDGAMFNYLTNASAEYERDCMETPAEGS